MSVTEESLERRTIWNTTWNAWVHFFLPCPCLACGRPLAAPAPRMMLCRPCRGRLITRRGASCNRCGRPLADSTLATCTACAARPPALERLWIPWHYLPPLDGVLQALKFRRLEHLGRDLASAAVEEIGRQRLVEGRRWSERRIEASRRSIDLVVPVPLHWRRRFQRGYNQAEAIARPLARLLDLPLARALRRPRATPPQTGLGRQQRLRNPRRAFRVPPREGAKLDGKGVLLVDDVVTTGATLQAAALCLRQAGARWVEGFAIARSPEDHEPAASHRASPDPAASDPAAIDRASTDPASTDPGAGHWLWS